MLENNKQHQELDLNSMVDGVGRKATNEELINYLEKGFNDEPIDLEEALFKFKLNNFDHE